MQEAIFEKGDEKGKIRVTSLFFIRFPLIFSAPIQQI